MAHTSHTWKFYRIGGLDQVAVETGEDLLHLKDLDQKLWVALSCPVKGLEADEKTLALIDTDKDGRVRAPELLDAIDWSSKVLRDVGDLLKENETLSLSAFNTDTPEGKAVASAAKEMLAGLGEANASGITLAQASSLAKVYAATKFNGDGIVTPASSDDDEAIKAVIADIVATQGGALDRSGVQGVNQAQVDAFYADLAAFADWSAKGATAEILTLGALTAAASAAVKAVQAKVDDYFARTRMASFDNRALAALNRSETEYLALAAKDLSITAEEVAGFPLARIDAGKPLPLTEGVNPAWAGAVATLLNDAVTPALGSGRTTLTEAEWASLKAKVAAYDAHAAVKGGVSVEKLGLDRVKALRAANQKEAIGKLITADLDLADEFAAAANLEKILLFARDFRTIVRNFVNFTDFYSPDRWAVFQAGTLYLDSRSTEFCVRVDGPHALAVMSKAYIAYCDLKRPGEAMKIAACFTQGDSDYLFVGRNGLFYDRKGRDWDATITSIVENPISIRQAFFAPYKKFLRMIEEQVAKRAAAADAESNAKLAAAADKTANADKAAPAAAPKKVDIGTVAAIGVAVTGAVSVLTLIIGYIFGMKAWQYPLAFLGIILLISGPAMLIAWLKLRQRTLGPILEGNGWAINGRVKINIPFGTKLTERAVLPANSTRSLDDPYEDKAAAGRRRFFIFLFILVLAGVAALFWDKHRRGHFFWEDAPVVAPTEQPAEPAPAPATTG